MKRLARKRRVRKPSEQVYNPLFIDEAVQVKAAHLCIIHEILEFRLKRGKP